MIYKKRKTFHPDAKIDYTRLLLGTISLYRGIEMAIALSNSLRDLGIESDRKLYRTRKNYLTKKIKKLKEDGLIKYRENEIILTSKGEHKLALLRSKEKAKGLNWDKKWRLVIFDIREKNKKERDYLRKELSDFNFIKLQNSVWVSPYDCEEFIALLKAEIGLDSSVLFVVSDYIDGEEKLIKMFFNK